MYGMLNLGACHELMQKADAVIERIPDTSKGLWPQNRAYVIAGGATRDSLLAREVADIDVVIEPHAMKCWDVDWREFPTDYSDGYITHTAQAAEDVDGHPINLLVRNASADVHTIANYHAVSLSNAFWIDGSLTLHRSFMRSVIDEKLWINPTRVGTPGLAEYMKKIIAKYPTWAVGIWPTPATGEFECEVFNK